MQTIISPVSDDAIKQLCAQIGKYNEIKPEDFERFDVKRGLRNADGTGVMAGITRICNVEGYYVDDGERIPREGRLMFRGINMADIVEGCVKENRYGFEEVAWLLLFGSLPTKDQLAFFCDVLSQCRQLPEDFIEDMILKTPSPDIMNKLARSVLGLYAYDSNPDDTSIENVMRQSMQIIAQVPFIMTYAYQVKRRHYYHKSMYIHQPKNELNTAESVLRSIRRDKEFAPEEAKLLDICLMVHAEHGGGNNSTFATRVLTSSGTDTYSAIAAGIGSLKGPKHGGANIKVSEMLNYIKEGVSDITNEDEVADFIGKLIRREAGDRSGLIYGMGHAVYTVSDPRAVILKKKAEEFSRGTDYERDYQLIKSVEKLTPQVFEKLKGGGKVISANVDLYSGLIYKMLGIPEDLYTPIFTVARVVGWSAHRIEELLTGNRIIRPAYKNINPHRIYIPIENRTK